MNADKYYAAVDMRSQSWSRTRIARMTRAILCLALAEIEYLKDVPPSVAVNEAVELAKQYDTEKAPAYINGILGSFFQDSSGGLIHRNNIIIPVPVIALL
jgi:N utilization substance protein B